LANYVIINYDEITEDVLRCGACKSIDDVRTNNDGTKAVFKFDIKNHAPFLGKTWLNEEQIKQEMAKNEWGGDVGIIQSLINKLGI
jgi:hypothetical protein